MLEPCICCE